MKIKEKKCKQIISDSGIYDIDYSINPYTGCSHKCSYCYATYMKKFTDHKEPWGEFVDVKTNASDALRKELRKKEPGNILLSSVTDPYQPIEKEYEITKKILEILKDSFFEVNILTKSNLILRDIDLLKEFDEDLTVGFTINFLEEKHRRNWEPNTSKISERIQALKEIYNEGINTYVRVGPFFPGITDLKEITKEIDPYVFEIQVENLNTRDQQKIKQTIQRNYPKLIEEYDEIIEEDQRINYKLLKEAKELKEITDTEISIFLD